MRKETFEMLEYVYDNVICPKCGVRKTYRPTVGDAFDEGGCSHTEVMEIIEQREQEYLARIRPQEPLRVRLRLSPTAED
ncbi:MAG: hypothetical protein LBH91_03175 [Prevotellaceae bacterium]|nr:hypothetical protein [Prevotellaceae bacterium]